MMRKRFGQGARPLHATLAAGVAAATLSACTPDHPLPAQMPRAVYASQEACMKDWSSPDCTPAPLATPPATTTGGYAGGGGGGGYYGPYMYNGYYYHPYGGYAPMTSEPRNAQRLVESPPPARVAEAFRSSSAISRGGLGSSAHGESGGE